MMELFPSLRGRGPIGLDTESFEPDIKKKGSAAFRDGRLVGISVACQGHAHYYPIAHETGPNLDKRNVLSWLKKELADPKQPKIGANLLHDLSYLHVNGVEVRGPTWDVQNAEPLLVEDRFNYGLDAISKDYLGEGKSDERLDEALKSMFGKKNPKANIWRMPADHPALLEYAVDDARKPLLIFEKQRPLLEGKELWELFLLESKLIPMLLAMKARGVKVNLQKAHAMHDRLTAEKRALLEEIRRVTGHEIDIWAAASIAKAFDAMDLPYPLTPKTKVASFTAGWLENHEHPMCQMIVEARRKDKMCGTFLEGGIFESHINGRIHCNFNQLKGEGGGAVSGRFSSSNPNLQFIPVRTDEGKLIREMFEPDDGCRWYKKDWSQVEYRLIVHDAAHLGFAGAAEVVRQYHDDPDTDFHQAVADMTGLSRGSAKTINFGLAYGEGVAKLARQLNLPFQEAEALIKEYHRRAPFIKRLMDMLMGQAARTGEVRTMLNRLRTFNAWELRKWNRETRTYDSVILRQRVHGARRAFTHKALNARIQGSAADLMKKAMVDIWESGICDVLGPPQLTVHDELDGSLPPGRKAREALNEGKRLMEHVVPLLVPLKVDMGIGENWGSIH